MRNRGAGRLGLLWQSEAIVHNGQPHVVRVVQRGTRLKSTGGLNSLPDELAGVMVVALLPLRLFAMLVTGQRYKVGIVRINGRDSEEIALKERVRGEDDARSRALNLFADMDRALQDR